MSQSERVVATVRKFLTRQNKASSVDLDTSLFSEGLGLDSLQTAELSVLLEDELGKDPFSSGQMPQNIGEIVSYYDEPTS